MPSGEPARGAGAAAGRPAPRLRRPHRARRRRPGARRPGESLVVLGPNGAGKTTLLRILATLLRPSGGEVVVLGCSLPREAWKLRGRIGYLGHEPLLYRDLSGRENLRFHARLHGIAGEAAEARIAELLAAVGMERRADERVAELSAGMRQRLAICRCVLHEPRAAAARRARLQPRRRGPRAGPRPDRPGRRAHPRPRHPRPRALRCPRPTACSACGIGEWRRPR